MSWLKGLGKSLWIAIGIFLAAMAVMAAKRQKSVADNWKGKAVAIEEGNVVKGIDTAEAALSQAKKFDAKADELQAKAVKAMDRAGRKDESTADLLSRWKK